MSTIHLHPRGRHAIAAAAILFTSFLLLIIVNAGQAAPPPPVQLTLIKETDPAGGTGFPFTVVSNGPSLIFGNGPAAAGNLLSPHGLARDAAGNLYVADGGNYRVQKFDTSGAFLLQWGSQGTGAGQFDRPVDIAIDTTLGEVYVSEDYNSRVQVFDLNGNFLRQWGSRGTADGQFQGANGIAFEDATGLVYVADGGNDRIQRFLGDGTFVDKWGSSGSAAGQFSTPHDVAVDSAGNIYVTDAWANNRVQKFDSSLNYITRWGGWGSGNGQFQYPNDIDFDSAGNVYVADFQNNRVQVFTSGGAYLRQWGTYGSGIGQFARTTGIVIDRATDTVYVSDYQNNRIQVFDHLGAFLGEWAMLTNPGDIYYPRSAAVDAAGNVYVADHTYLVKKFDRHGNPLIQFGGPGTGNGQFNRPKGIAVDGAGNIFVADSDNNRMQKFDAAGNFILTWGSLGSGNGQFSVPTDVAIDSAGNVYVVDFANYRVQKFNNNGVYISQWGTNGTADGQMKLPYGIAIDGADYIYITEQGNQRVQKFDTSGVFLAKWGSSGSGDGQFNSPAEIGVDNAGHVYVADQYNHRVQKFSDSGVFLGKWGSQGAAAGQFEYPTGLAVDDKGNAYIADTNNHRIQKFVDATATLDDDGSVTYALDPGSFTIAERPLGGWGATSIVCDGGSPSYGSTSVGLTLANGDDVTCTFTNEPPPKLTIVKETDPDGATGFPFTLTSEWPAFTWGSYGSAAGQFYYPTGVAVGPTGDIYIAERLNYRIQRFDKYANHLSMWGSGGSGDGQFDNANWIAIDSTGNIYVSDMKNNRMQKFDADGNFLLKWGSGGSGDGQFNWPMGVAVHDGFVYVTEYFNHRVQKFTDTGVFVTRWGTLGSGDGQFNNPHGIVVDADGFVYVADSNNHRIQKFTDTGVLVSKWGANGSGDGQFKLPTGIAIDEAGYLYVADNENGRIQKFTRQGDFLGKWGGSGKPMGMAIGLDGFIYVTDFHNHVARALIDTSFTLDDDGSATYTLDPGSYTIAERPLGGWGATSIVCDGGSPSYGSTSVGLTLANGDDVTCTFINTADPAKITLIKQTDPAGATGFPFTGVGLVGGWGVFGYDPGQFNGVLGIAFDNAGNIYVADRNNSRIQKFAPNGNRLLATWSSYLPSDVAVDDAGDVYAVDFHWHRITKTDNDGNLLLHWGGSWGNQGSTGGRLTSPTSVDLDSAGLVYVADAGNQRIHVFDNVGNFIMAWGWDVVAGGDTGFEVCTEAALCKAGSSGNGDGQFDWPSAVRVGPDDKIYVTDKNNNRVQRFTSDGTFELAWPSDPTVLSGPTGLDIDSDGNVYVADNGHSRMHMFANDGTLLMSWPSSAYGVGLDADGHVIVSNGWDHINIYTSFATTLDDGGSEQFTVEPAQYAVSELVPGNWELSDISCTSGSPSRDGDTVSLTLGPAVDVTCTFTNTAQTGSITVIKEVVGQAPPTDWDYTGDLGTFVITATGGTKVFTDQLVDSYTITETAKTGYDQTVSCDSGESGTDSVTVGLDPGENVTCTFTNTAQTGSIRVVKQVIGVPSGTDWSFAFTGDLGPFTLTQAITQTAFSDLYPGNYTITETVGSNYAAAVICNSGESGTDSVIVGLDPGEDVVCTFTNTAHAPVAEGLVATTPEDTPLPILLTATDADGDSLTYSIVDGPTYGALSSTPPDLTYTPDEDYYGPDSFTYQANDGLLDSNIATVDITVEPVNDPPIAQDLDIVTEGGAPVNITLQATDCDSAVLTYTVVTEPLHGTLSGTGPDLVYTPGPDSVGFDSFTYTASDCGCDSAMATVTIHTMPLVFVTTQGGTTPMTYLKGDILRWDGESWSKWYSSAAAGLPLKSDLIAFDVKSDTAGSAYLTYFQPLLRVPGTGYVTPHDILYYDGTTFSMFFDGSKVGLTLLSERIDGLEVRQGLNGCDYYLLIMTMAGGSVRNGVEPPIRFYGEDVLGFCMTNPGVDTRGRWELYFDGSAEGLVRNNGLDISASPSMSTLYLLPKMAFTADGVTIRLSEVAAFDMTSRTFSGPVWKAKANGLLQALDGLDVIGILPFSILP